MRRLLVIAVTILLPLGCGGGGTERSPTSVTAAIDGPWRLTAVNGSPLPARIVRGDTTWDYQSASLGIFSGGLTWTLAYRVTLKNLPMQANDRGGGDASFLGGDQVRVVWAWPSTGTFAQGVLSLDSPRGTFRFER